jgi:hypothetical protein
VALCVRYAQPFAIAYASIQPHICIPAKVGHAFRFKVGQF